MPQLEQLEEEIKKLENKNQAKILQRFFKTGPGHYGEGDVFLGIMVPQTRKLAKQFEDLSLDDLQQLLNTKIHEKRLLALIILVNRYKKLKTAEEKRELYDFYLQNTRNVNNWDLVDLSCRDIVGQFILENLKEKKTLYKLANSNHLWEKRIAIVSTWQFIRQKQFEDTIKISEILLKDKHDLIHKAVGWMLREIGKKDQGVLLSFLDKHYKHMPRTSLRYAIERLPKKLRKHYLLK
jgi:3-methyladenine DNA glycosylase AlkD